MATTSNVLNTQKFLKAQGFFYGEPNGEHDSQTQAAIRRYQIRNGLTVTGNIDDGTRLHMADQPQWKSVTSESAPAVAINPSPQPAAQTRQPTAQERRAAGPGSHITNAPPVFTQENPQDQAGGAPNQVAPVAAPEARKDEENPTPGNENAAFKANGARKTAQEIGDDRLAAIKAARADDAKTAKDKQASDIAGAGESGKVLWSQKHEQIANYELKHGHAPPPGTIMTGATNVGGNPANIPPGMKDQFRTEWGDTAPKKPNGTSNDAIWNKLFPNNAQRWSDTGAARMTDNSRGQGQYEERGFGPGGAGTGRFVPQQKPADTLLSDHFGVDWSNTSAPDRLAMLKSEVPQWTTPDQTASDVGAGGGEGTQVLSNSTGPLAGVNIPAGSRTVSKNGQLVGFATPKLPSAVPVTADVPDSQTLPSVADNSPSMDDTSA